MNIVTSLQLFIFFNDNVPNNRIIAYCFSFIKTKNLIKGFDPAITLAGINLLVNTEQFLFR